MKVTHDTITEEELRALIASDRRGARTAANAFAAACTAGDADAFFEAIDLLNVSPYGGWRFAMMRVAKLPDVNAEIRSAFLDVWIEIFRCCRSELATGPCSRPHFKY